MRIGERLRSLAVFPFYAIGWVGGRIVRAAVVVWSTVRLGYMEARGESVE